MNAKKERRIRVSYNRAKDFRIVAATGAFGGATPQAEVLCNFYIEFQDYPQGLAILLDEETGSFREEIESPEIKTIRELQFGVVMRPEIAKIVGQWLIEESNKLLPPRPEIKPTVKH